MNSVDLILPWPPSVPGTYRIVDVSSSRFYIGSSADLQKRWGQHVYRLTRGDHPNPIMQAAWNQSSERLQFEVIEQLPGADRERRLVAEQVLLDAAGVGSNRFCMNILQVAGSHQGRKRSESTREKLREVNRGRSPSAETRQKMRAAKVGRPLTAQHRARIGDAVRGKPCKRPNGIVNHRLRAFTPEQIRHLRALRAEGLSWRLLAIEAGQRDHAVLRRAVLSKTYRDVSQCT